MTEARSFKYWTFHAMSLDRISGRNRWKNVKYSDDYDYRTTEYLLEYLRELRSRKLIRGVVHTLRSTLRKNINGIANPVLYEKSNVGTKQLIEDFHEEIVKCLKFIFEFSDESQLKYQEKIEFFLETR